MLVQDTSGLAEGISQASSALSKGLMERAKKQRLQSIQNMSMEDPYQPTQPQQGGTVLSNTVGEPDQQGVEGATPSAQIPQEVKPIYQQKYEQQQGRVQLLKKQAALLRGEGYPEEAKSKELEAYHTETMAQNEMLAQRKQVRSEFTEERKYETKKGEKGAEKIESIQESLAKKRMAIDMAKSSVESGDVGQFSKANIAKRLGIPELQTAKGSQLITASKEHLLGNMSRVSAKGQNIWFEKRLDDMFAKVGQSAEANLTSLEMLDGEVLMDEALTSKYQELEAQDIEKYGYAKGDLTKRARKETEQLDQKIFDRSIYRMRKLQEEEMGMKSLRRKVGKQVIEGTPLTMGTANLYIRKFGDLKTALSAAKKNGYRIPSKDEIDFYEKSSRDIRGEE